MHSTTSSKAYLITILNLLICFHLHSQIKINELVSSNSNTLMDEDGDYPDWVEFINTSENTINLATYSFTDDIENPTKWNFPDINIHPDDFLVLFTSGKNRLKQIGSWQTIINKGAHFKYLVPNSEIGNTWKDTGFNDQNWSEGASGFGYGDDDETIIDPAISLYVRKEFEISNLEEISDIAFHIDYDDGFIAYINGIEIARDKLGTAGSPVSFDTPCDDYSHEALIYQGKQPDSFEIANVSELLKQGTNVLAIEVHNHTATSSDLSCIPFLSLGLKPKGLDIPTEYFELDKMNLHTNFKIKSLGEPVYLFNNLQMVDSVCAKYLPSDMSYGRQPDGSTNWLYFATPTPMASNTSKGYSTLTEDSVFFSMQGGYFSNTISLELYSKNGASNNIFYTTDGSSPDINSTRYQHPIQINTHSVIRARIIDTDKLPGPVTTNTYIFGQQHNLPAVCLSTSPDNLWDYNSGIYADGPNMEPDYPHFGANYWQDWEKPVHFEFYDENGIKQVDQLAGLKIFGNYSRSHPQKSFSLFARNKYGKGAFKYKFFADKENNEFESLVLRNSGSDYYKSHFRDGLLSSLVKEIDLEYQGFQPTVVYLNGEYWGILNLREKVNEHFISDNSYVKTDSLNILEINGLAIQGNNMRYEEMLNFITYNDLNTEDNYKTVSDIIEVDNFINYFLFETFIANGDWPGNNIKYWNTNSIRSKYRWIVFDTDFGFGLFGDELYKYNSIADALASDNPSWPNPPWSTLLFRKLTTNEDFKEKFAQKGCDYLNTYWESSKVIDQVNTIETLIDNEMEYHCERWNLDYNEWHNEVERLRIFADERPFYFRQFLGEAMGFDENYSIEVETFPSESGKVKVNSIYPGEYPFYGSYFENIPVKLKAIPNPGYKFAGWEGDVESSDTEITYPINDNYFHRAIFEPSSEENHKVIINEIFYKSTGNLKPGDWIELYNNGETTVDLKGWTLRDANKDSAYIVPSSYYLAPGDFIVFCKDIQKFKTIYPNIKNVMGNFSFGLNADGDHIRLFNQNNTLIDAVDYYPTGVWPLKSYNQSASIELSHPRLNNEKGENWMSSENGGTPGEHNQWLIDNSIHDIKNKLNASLSCAPNPITNHANITFQIRQTGKYHLDLVNINGAVVHQLSSQQYNIGIHTVYISEDQLASLKNGVYLIRLMGNRGLETIKIIKKQ